MIYISAEIQGTGRLTHQERLRLPPSLVDVPATEVDAWSSAAAAVSALPFPFAFEVDTAGATAVSSEGRLRRSNAFLDCSCERTKSKIGPVRYGEKGGSL